MIITPKRLQSLLGDVYEQAKEYNRLIDRIRSVENDSFQRNVKLWALEDRVKALEEKSRE